MKTRRTIAIFFLCIIQTHGNQHIATGTISQLMLQDQAIAEAIRHELTKQESMEMHFPNSVKRYYKQHHFKPSWVNSAGVAEQTWDAMLLFDCVAQYGLLHSDYHPKQLLYEQLERFMEKPSTATAQEKARFEIALTDALLTFMNHLHYGRLNPLHPEKDLDHGNAGTFDAVTTLTGALQQDDFMATVTGVQPTSTEYIALQQNMKLVAGQNVGDCYEIPEGDIRKMAINMERLRWLNCDGEVYIHINIPAYTLVLHRPDSDYLFRIVVGKPTTPTALTQGYIRYFYTAPEWKVPGELFTTQVLPSALEDPAFLQNNRFVIYDGGGNPIEPNQSNLNRIKQDPDSYYARQSTGTDNSLGKIVFRFSNPDGIYLSDTPDQQSFRQSEKAISNGNIQVEGAEKLAALLLEADGASLEIPSLQAAMALYERHTFTLKKPVPIYVSYLTCEIKNGLLEIHEDPYGLDAALETFFYN